MKREGPALISGYWKPFSPVLFRHYYHMYWKDIFQRILHSCWWKLIFSLVETVCFCSETFFCSWKSWLKLGGILTEKYFPASGNHFRFFCQKKQFFRIVETYFSMNASFRIVETDFLASANHRLVSKSNRETKTQNSNYLKQVYALLLTVR